MQLTLCNIKLCSSESHVLLPWKWALVSLRDSERVGLIRPSDPSFLVILVCDPSS